MTEHQLTDLITSRLGDKIEPGHVHNNGYRPAGVLVPLLNDGDRWRVLFTKRTDRVESHKGQISFPGGAHDDTDPDLSATAVRETEEEIGVAGPDIKLIASLEPTPTISRFMVYPYVGLIPHPYDYELNPAEVDRLIDLPLEGLIDEACDQREAAGPADWSVRFNRDSQDVIWGATARILYHFLKVAFLDQQRCP